MEQGHTHTPHNNNNKGGGSEDQVVLAKAGTALVVNECCYVVFLPLGGATK